MLVFVLGTGRCGSSLVHEVLARHPAVGFISNVEDLVPRLRLRGGWNNPLYRRMPPSLTRKDRPRFAPSEGYALLDRHVSPALSRPFRDLTSEDATPWLAERTRRFFEARIAAQGRPIFSHKFTGWPRARFLHAVFPGARFVHVVRDGRDVANSFLKMRWWDGHLGPSRWRWGPLPEAYAAEWADSGQSLVTLAGLSWKMLMDAYDEAERAVPALRWLTRRYEDIIADPDRRFSEILRFAGLEPDARFDRALAAHTFSPDRRGLYRKDLGDGCARALERSLHGHLVRHGYPVGAASS